MTAPGVLADRLPQQVPGLLSVIVPVRNKRNSICEILRRMRTVPLPFEREIIVVNDASDDGTDKVLTALEDSTIRVISHRREQGESAAIRTGLTVARGDLLLFQDPDLRYPPEDWPSLLAPVIAGRTQVVYGSRYIGAKEAVPLRQWASDHAVGLCASLLFNRIISDLDATKVVDRAVLDDADLLAPATATNNAARFDFDAELTARLLRGGHRIYEVPVRYAPRSAPTRQMVWQKRLSRSWDLVRLRFS